MLDYVQVALTALIGVISAVAPLRTDGRLTVWGRTLVLLAAFGFAIAIFQAQVNRQERENLTYRFNLSSLQLTLEASYFSPLADDSTFLTNAPAEFSVPDARLGEHMLVLDFVAVRAVYKPSRARMSPPGYIFYSARSVRSSDLNPGPLPYEYLWDLNGKRLSFRVPINKFQEFVPGRKWTIRGTVLVPGKAFRGYPNERGEFEFILDDLSAAAVKGAHK